VARHGWPWQYQRQQSPLTKQGVEGRVDAAGRLEPEPSREAAPQLLVPVGEDLVVPVAVPAVRRGVAVPQVVKGVDRMGRRELSEECGGKGGEGVTTRIRGGAVHRAPSGRVSVSHRRGRHRLSKRQLLLVRELHAQGIDADHLRIEAAAAEARGRVSPRRAPAVSARRQRRQRQRRLPRLRPAGAQETSRLMTAAPGELAVASCCVHALYMRWGWSQINFRIQILIPAHMLCASNVRFLRFMQNS
jgi:hypothetical protein